MTTRYRDRIASDRPVTPGPLRDAFGWYAVLAENARPAGSFGRCPMCRRAYGRGERIADPVVGEQPAHVHCIADQLRRP